MIGVMPENCSLCGVPLHWGTGSNHGRCVVCSIVTCIRCTRYGFCPAHLQALSPRGLSAVKTVYYGVGILIVSILLLVLLLGLSPLGEYFPPRYSYYAL